MLSGVAPLLLYCVVQVNALPLLGPPINIIPRTNIPISRSQCNFPVTTRRQIAATSATAPPSSSPPVQHPATCQALQRIAQSSASQCTTVDSCTAVDCNFMSQYHARLTVEPCHNPPAVGVVVRNNLGATIVDETLVDSRSQPIDWNHIHLFDLITNITHRTDPDAIVLKVGQ